MKALPPDRAAVRIRGGLVVSEAALFVFGAAMTSLGWLPPSVLWAVIGGVIIGMSWIHAAMFARLGFAAGVEKAHGRVVGAWRLTGADGHPVTGQLHVDHPDDVHRFGGRIFVDLEDTTGDTTVNISPPEPPETR